MRMYTELNCAFSLNKGMPPQIVEILQMDARRGGSPGILSYETVEAAKKAWEVLGLVWK